MANIGEITQASYYQGNPALGGGSEGVVMLDLGAFQRLSDYAFMAKKNELDNKYAEFKDNAAKVADALKIDWANIRPDHAKAIHAKEKELVEFLRSNPAASQKSGTPEFLKFYGLKNELDNLTKAGATRSTEYAAIAKKISDTAPDGVTLKKWMADLDAKFAKNDINTPLNPFEDYKSKPINWSGPNAVISRDVAGANFIKKNNYAGYDFGKGEAYASTLPVNLDEGQVGFEQLAQMKDMAGVYNALIQKGILAKPELGYAERDTDGKFIRFTPKALNDPMYGGIIRTIDAWNKGVVDYNNAATGLTGNPINPDQEIDEFGVRKLLGFALAGERKASTDLQYTGRGDQNANAAASRQLQQRGLALQERAMKIREDESTGNSTGTGGQISLYGDLVTSMADVEQRGKAIQYNNKNYVKFQDLDKGVQERLVQAMGDSYGVDMRGNGARSLAEGQVFSFMSDGSVITGKEEQGGAIVEGPRLSQSSLNILEANVNKITGADVKIGNFGGTNQPRGRTVPIQDF